MKKISSILFVLVYLFSLLATPVSAAPLAITTTPSSVPQDLGQLKICKSAGAGVTVGQLFTINVNNTSYSVPAGPTDGGYCVLTGQFPLNSDVTVQEVIPAGYDVSDIEVKPDRAVDTDVSLGKVIIEIGSGVTEVIFTNRASGLPTQTPGPSNTPTATPNCSPNCTPTSTPTPKGRLQICKEADGAGVSGYFKFDFANRSKAVPVGACSALITVEAGTLTITEVAEAGYKVTDVYTIPANRLISKNLNSRSATVTIVQGNASSQTIVIFRNRADNQTVTPTHTPTGTITPATSTPTGTITPPTPTPTGTITPATPTPTGTITPPTPTPTGTITPATPTPTGTITPPTPTPTGTITTATFTPTGTITPSTPTPTGTITPPVCTPVVVTANFNNIPVGQTIEGLGVVAPGLNIDAKGTAAKVQEATAPFVYFAAGTQMLNGGLNSSGGFSDVTSQQTGQAHLYNFTFTPGTTVSDFSLHMLDFGDLNPSLSTNHYVSMTAYNTNGVVVAKQELSYTSSGEFGPVSSPQYGNMQVAGDATAATPGQPGNWTWHVSGSGIVRVVLEFGVGYDPNIAFDNLSFATECPAACQPSAVTANFNNIPVGQTIEGLGVVAPGLNIDAKGTAAKVQEATAPFVYFAAGTQMLNGGLNSSGGFSDVTSQQTGQAHLYNFTFTPGTTVSDFSLHMLDFGDLNPSLSTNHYVSMTAYNTNGVVVAKQELSYTSSGEFGPVSSPQYGNMQVAGDATAATPGQPGNWTWHVSGSGIVRVVLEFGVGYDPNIAFDNLSFATECPAACQPSAVTANFNNIPVGQTIEGLGVVAPGLNIDAKGTAAKVQEATAPFVYFAAGTQMLNGGLNSSGGFSDVTSQQTGQAHLYNFTFTPGTTVSDFSLHMLDFGDLNPSLSTNHYVSMTAYNTNGVVVAKQELSYTSSGEFGPVSSPQYGNMQVAGDATAATPGQPGNWTWHVSGSGIVRVVLEFGVGYDPNIAFDNLSFTTQCAVTAAR